MPPNTPIADATSSTETPSTASQRGSQMELTLAAMRQLSVEIPQSNSHLANIGTQLARIATALESIAADVRRPFTGGA